MSLSVFQIFKIGIGPSSSHTVGPMKAAKEFLLNAKKNGILDGTEIRQVKAELFGSLALTGKGHGTDKALIMGFIGEDPENIDTTKIYAKVDKIQQAKRLKMLKDKETNFTIQFHKSGKLPYHTNGMRFTLIDDNNEEVFKEVYYSIGGGFIMNENETLSEQPKKSNVNGNGGKKVPYPFKTADELFEHAIEKELTIPEIIMANEKSWNSEKEIKRKLDRIWEVMKNGIDRGINSPGILPGPLKIERRAPKIYKQLTSDNFNFMDPLTYMNWINCWAMAVSEENAIGGQVVTAPTNGAAGVIPACIEYYNRFYAKRFPNKIHDFLLTSAAVGMIIKTNATVSGAEGGCQAEIGAAASMAAAGLTCALDGNVYQIENAAEIALEHFIGLTCDPVGGLVQIPCIERNAIAAVKSINSTALALTETNKHKVSLDRIIRVMKVTGDDMKTKYKETSKGGIAKIMEEDFKTGIKLLKTKTEQEKEKVDDIDLYMNNSLC